MKPFIYTEKHISVLTPELREKTKTLKFLAACRYAGTTAEGRNYDILPHAPMERYPVFDCDTQKGTYNHHSAICKWRGRYYYAFSNGQVNEDAPGQSSMLSSSDDGKAWSRPVCVAAGDVAGGILMRVCGIFSWDDKLVLFVQKNWNAKSAVRAGMSINDDTVVECQIDAYVSDDARDWQIHENIVSNHWSFEEPKLTKQGRLLAPGTAHKTFVPTVLLWPGDNPLEKPEVIYMPFKSKDMSGDKEYASPREGHFPYGESSWYQDDDGRIWMYMRDESASTRLFISISEDGGQSWTEPMISDMPDSMSRIYAGRLSDGRFFLVGNSFGQLLDRSKLILSLSDDGAVFNKMYILIDGDTKQSHEGHLKTNGYQYPNCLVDGDRLFIAYSVNKEDMECGILDTSKI